MTYFRERDLEDDAKQIWELAGFDVTSLTVRRWGSGRGGFTVDPGIPDAYVRHPELKIRLFVEYKLEKEKPRPEQEAWHEKERKCGGTLLVIRRLDEIVEYCSEQGIGLELEDVD